MCKLVTLRVAEALKSDVGHGKARISNSVRKKLKVSPGDIIEIMGEQSTAAVVWRARPEDEGKDLIRIDGMVRKNAKISLGDHVNVNKAVVKQSLKVILAPMISEHHHVQFGHGIESFIKRALRNRPVHKGDTIIVPGIALMGGSLPFGVVNTQPKGIVQITADTDIVVHEEPLETFDVASQITYDNIGGLKDELRRVREMIELPLKHPELFDRLGIDPPKGVLLHGPPGTGKTLIARAVANESGANFISIQGPEIMNKFYGQSEENLRNKFEEAEKNPPSIVFIDELDSIAPKRGDVHGEVERRVVAQMLTLMDGLQQRGKLIVIAATNRVDAIDPALRRPGRFDREIEIGVPDMEGRLEILEVHTRGMPLKKKFDMNYFAEITHGYVGADLAALTREAAMKALRRYLPEINLDEPIPAEILSSMEVTIEDFKEALKECEPSALREVLIEIPHTTWEDVGGLTDIKQRLREVIEWPLKNPEVFKKMGIRPPRGILLFGAPGTGKTLLAKAIAHESNANFISIKGPEVLSKWVGESEKAVREIFKKAKQASPSIVFLDELDSLAPQRGYTSDSHVTERIVNQLLTSIDGLESMEGVVIIGATNRPDIIDPGLLRTGRFDRHILIPAPDLKTRIEIFKVHTSNMPLKDVSIEELAKLTDNYTGADIEGICREAGIIALRENIKTELVTMANFKKAIKVIRPSINENIVKYYERISKELEGGMHKRKKDDIGIGYR
ncbi:MAG: CDC48 family AAA ATPase [Thermoplasmata archaeon]|nr:MAG: CDC48 family AAA ATPase [Thermoplasmata archaeon]